MKKIIIGLLLLILMGAGVLSAVILLSERQQSRSSAAPATILSISPAALTRNQAGSFSLDINIETGLNQINGADLFLTFNPAVLEVLNITPGSFLPSAQEIGSRQIDNANGKIVYSLGVFDNANAKSGSGILATVIFKTKASGSSPINFTTGTSVAGVGETEALQNKVNGIVTVAASANPTATPTPTPVPGASPAPSATPTPTPTPIPGGATPTPTPTPIPGASLAPTATPSSAPVTASINPTFILFLSGLMLLGLGLVL